MSVFFIKKVDSSTNAVTIDGSGAETIDGATTYVLDVQGQAVMLVSDGSNWRVFASFNTTPRLEVVTKTTTYTALVQDDVIKADTSGGAWTLTLPDATTCRGKVLYIKKVSSDANSLTIDPNGSQTIDGMTTRVLIVQYDFMAVVSDGSNWQIIG